MSEVGCFTMHLYCDVEGCTNDRTGGYATLKPTFMEYTGETRGECRTKARRDGWVIPECVKEGKR